MTIQEIKLLLESVDYLDDPLFNKLQNDPRKGVQSLIQRRKKAIQRLHQQESSFNERLGYERQFWQQGIELIAGVDEVGRGPLAGPVVTCAVILPRDFDLWEVNDSKQLTPKKRAWLYPQILASATSVSLGVESSQVIDQLNIYQATRQAMRDAVEHLTVRPDSLLVDAMQIDVDIPQTKLFHGDAKSVSIGAASIVAKVYRDHLMDQYDQIYPEYDFKHNAGYGTKEHLVALTKYGATPIHRRSFAPVRDVFNLLDD